MIQFIKSVSLSADSKLYSTLRERKRERGRGRDGGRGGEKVVTNYSIWNEIIQLLG